MGKKLAKFLHHGLGQHAQDVEIHGELLGDSMATKKLRCNNNEEGAGGGDEVT